MQIIYNICYLFSSFPLLRIIKFIPVATRFPDTFLCHPGKIKHVVHVRIFIIFRCQYINSATNLDTIIFPSVYEIISNGFHNIFIIVY